MGCRTFKGMTLLEVTVALALLSFLALGLLTAFRTGERTYAQVVRGTAQTRDVLRAQRTLRALIEAAELPDSTANSAAGSGGLEGTAETLTLSAPAPMAIGDAQRYRIGLRLRRDGTQDLVIDAAPGNYRAIGLSPMGATDEILVPAVQTLRWAYRSAPVRDEQGFAHDVPWRSSWQNQRHAPGLVALEIAFPPGDARHWPIFFAAPRITDTARCEFDVVAQACRDAGR